MTITIHRLEELVDLDSMIPCEHGTAPGSTKKCLSNYEQPAHWAWTHLGGGQCTFLYCDACDTAFRTRLNIQQGMNPFGYVKVDCRKCNVRIYDRERLVRREL